MITALMVVLYGMVSISILTLLWAIINMVVIPYKTGELHGVKLWLAYALYGFSYTWDVYCNMIWCTVLFVEFPRELTVSARLQRWVTVATGWRSRLARWVSVNIVNPLAYNGDHIHLPKE